MKIHVEPTGEGYKASFGDRNGVYILDTPFTSATEAYSEALHCQKQLASLGFL